MSPKAFDAFGEVIDSFCWAVSDVGVAPGDDLITPTADCAAETANLWRHLWVGEVFDMATHETTAGDEEQRSALEQRFDEIDREDPSATRFDAADVTRVIREGRDGRPSS